MLILTVALRMMRWESIGSEEEAVVIQCRCGACTPGYQVFHRDQLLHRKFQF